MTLSDETYTGGTALELMASLIQRLTNCNAYGDGIYSFPAVDSGEYKVYTAAGTELTRFGIIKIGEGGAVLTTGNQPIGGAKLSQLLLLSQVRFQLIRSQSEQVRQVLRWTGCRSKTRELLRPALSQTFQVVRSLHKTANHLTNKTYVDDLVASVEISPYQYGGNIRRVVSSATEQAGAYIPNSRAISSVGTTSATAVILSCLRKAQRTRLIAMFSNCFTRLVPKITFLLSASQETEHI